jgi:hypothetical protein
MDSKLQAVALMAPVLLQTAYLEGVLAAIGAAAENKPMPTVADARRYANELLEAQGAKP